jgi:hypothetical protein
MRITSRIRTSWMPGYHKFNSLSGSFITIVHQFTRACHMTVRVFAIMLHDFAAYTIAAARVIVVDPFREDVRIALVCAPGFVLCSVLTSKKVFYVHCIAIHMFNAICEDKEFALWVALAELTTFVYGPYSWNFPNIVTSPALVSLIFKALAVCWFGAGPSGALAKANVIRHSARRFVERTR